MKLRSLTLTAAGFIAITLCTPAARADDALLNANNEVGIAAGAQHLSYREWNEKLYPLDGENGTLKKTYSIFASTQSTWFGITDMYASASFDYSKGHTSYVGYLVNSDTGALTPATARTPTRITDYQLRLGRAFSVNAAGTAQLIPYIDGESHAWDRYATKSDDYSEYYRNQTVGAGVLGQYSFGHGLVAGVFAQIGSTIDPSMHASNQPGTFNLGSKLATAIGLNADYAITRRFHVDLSYRWNHFRYGVAANGNYVEPDSESTQQRLEIGAAYSF